MKYGIFVEMGNQTTIWDPLRRKEVALTPEERVRQWFIAVLRDCCCVPEHMMRSEVAMEYGSAGKTFRADIVVFGRDASPAAIVECKRPEVPLTAEVLTQALRYDMVQKVRYIIITNGNDTRAFSLSPEGWQPLAELPKYEQII